MGVSNYNILAWKELESLYESVKEDQEKGNRVTINREQVPNNITKDKFSNFIVFLITKYREKLPTGAYEDYFIQAQELK